MISKTDIKCIFILLYLAEVIHCTILILELRPETDVETSEEHEDKDNVLITNNVAWVKRIVPSNYKSPKYEYDSKFKTIFAPKYRVHKRKAVKPYEDNGKSLLDQVLLQPFASKTHDREVVEYLDRVVNDLKDEGVHKVHEKDLRLGGEMDHPPHEHKPFKYPHYSLWNYWTYEKDLQHDDCPGQEVKVGTMCIWAPPHRK